MNNEMIMDLLKSKTRQKKLIENHNIKLSKDNQKEIEPSNTFIAILVIKNLFRFHYFDSCKCSFLLKKLQDSEKIQMLKDLKNIYIEKVFPINELVLNSIDLNEKPKIYSSLLKFVSDKLNYDKTKFEYNSKFYKKASEIDLDRLKNYLDDGQDEYAGLNKFAQSMGYSYKSVLEVAKHVLDYKYESKDSLNLRKISSNTLKILEVYLLKRFLMHQDKEKLIYVDESCFCNTKRKRRIWANKHNPNSFLTHGRIKSLNLIIAISNNKVESHFINHNNNNGETFLRFIRILEGKLKNNNETKNDYRNSRFCIYMDNARIHKCKKVKEYLKKSNLRTIMPPPYHPEINPCEYAFREMKRKFYSIPIKNR